jgi:hypothetical protein
VTHTFEKVLKLFQSKGKKAESEDEEQDDIPAEEDGRPLSRTLRYREICVLAGPLRIWIGVREPLSADRLSSTAAHVNYFGRRGGFFQLTSTEPAVCFDERATVIDPLGWSPARAPIGDVACLLDDLGPSASLAHVSPYSDEAANWDTDRIVRPRILAMRRVSSSAHFTVYARVGD